MNPRAEIHDLGYKRYAGPRNPQAARWRVIMRHQVAQGWKSWWRYRIALVATVLATAIAAVVMYVYQSYATTFLVGEPRVAETVVPLATLWYGKIGLLFSMTLAAPAIADDTRGGAFAFYFVRSTRTVDYVAGKLAGLCVLALPILLVGPLVLAGIQLALTPDNQRMVDFLGVLPRTVAVGLLGTLLYAAIPLGISALAGARAYAIGAWALYYLVVGEVADVLGLFVWRPLAALDLGTALSQTSLGLAGQHIDELSVPLWATIPGILVPVVLSIALAAWKVRRARDTGVGGAS